MQAGDDGEEENGAQELFLGDPNPGCGMDLQQHHEEHGGDLGEGVGFAEDAGTEVSKPGDRVKNRADNQYRDITAEYHDCEFPGNAVKNRKHQKDGAEKKFVGDGIKILAENRLLLERAREQAVEAVAETGQDEQNERGFVAAAKQVNDDEWEKRHPQQGELVGRGKELREFHERRAPLRT